jgi:ribosome modulation factor
MIATWAQASSQGFMAGEAGVKFRDCPYRDPELIKHWRVGWFNAVQFRTAKRLNRRGVTNGKAQAYTSE